MGRSGCVALFLYPTKALAQDQLGKLQAALDGVRGLDDKKILAVDGDVPHAARADIMAAPPAFIATNPDMLHYTVLPGAGGAWSRLVLLRRDLFR